MIHITKRKELPFAKTIGIRVAAIALALVVCGVITMILTGLIFGSFSRLPTRRIFPFTRFVV